MGPIHAQRNATRVRSNQASGERPGGNNTSIAMPQASCCLTASSVLQFQHISPTTPASRGGRFMCVVDAEIVNTRQIGSTVFDGNRREGEERAEVSPPQKPRPVP